MYLQPVHDQTITPPITIQKTSSKLNIDPAIKLLDRHSTKIDPEKVTIINFDCCGEGYELDCAAVI